MKKNAHLYFFEKLKSKPDASERIFPVISFKQESIKKVHFIGICGKAMASLAGLFIHAGYNVTGSDESWNPPMSTVLESLGVTGNSFSVENLKDADLVVVGNAYSASNIEAQEARRKGLPQISSAEAYASFFIKNTCSIVITGTHGKTTTSALMTHVFSFSKIPTNALIGGVLKNTGDSYVYNKEATYSIVEGDEYDTAYFDKAPKFLHYIPQIGIITSIEFDHSDIYNDMKDYFSAFVFFAQEIPKNGILFLSESIQQEYRDVLVDVCEGKVYTYGFTNAADIYAENIRTEENGQFFDVHINNKEYKDFFLPLSGKYNIENALSVIATSVHENISEENIKKAFYTFLGTEQRQQVLLKNSNATVIDDFAHHPTAVKVTLEGIRAQYPNDRIIAIFEPRSSTSRRKDFEIPYSESFDSADIICLKKPPFRENDNTSNFIDIHNVISNIKDRKKEAHSFLDVDEIIEFIKNNAQKKDIIVLMSNGNFDGLREKIVKVF